MAKAQPLGTSWFIRWEVFKLSGAVLEMPLLIDTYSLTFIFTVRIIARAIYLFSLGYISQEKFFYRFHALVFLFVLSIFVLILRPNLIRVLLGWDGLGVTSYLLVIYFQSRKSYNAGILTALSNRVGDVLILLAIGLWAFSKSWNYGIVAMSQIGQYPYFVMLVVIAACTKSAQIPFSAWLPAAIAAPTPVSSLVHSSTLVTAGVYLIFRFYPRLSHGLEGHWLLVTGAATMLMAGLAALKEIDMKKIVALSTLSQLGVIITSMGAGLYTFAYFHIIAHAYFKALLFITVGAIIHMSCDYQDLRKTRSLSFMCPLTLSFNFRANLSLCGGPFIAGFYSKDRCIEGFIGQDFSSFLSGVFFVATALTVIYTFRFIYLIFSSSLWRPSLSWANDKDFNINFSMLILFPLAVFGGRLLSWALLASASPIPLNSVEKNLTLSVISAGLLLGLWMASGASRLRGGLGLLTFNIWALPLLSSRLHSNQAIVLARQIRQNSDLKYLQDLIWRANNGTRPISLWWAQPLSSSHLFLTGALIVRLLILILLYLCVINFFTCIEVKSQTTHNMSTIIILKKIKSIKPYPADSGVLAPRENWPIKDMWARHRRK